jgi:fatty acid desaturase
MAGTGSNTMASPSVLEVSSRQLVNDLHEPRSIVFWSDMLASAALGWIAFLVAVFTPRSSPTVFLAIVVCGFAFYRGLCFTHELTHLRRGALVGFETVWNCLLGVPLLLPTFTYLGVHQSHHHPSTYGTSSDPEYLPFATSRRLIFVFAVQSALLLPVLLAIRFLILSPPALLWPRFHRWLERHASSFAMNPAYRRVVSPAMSRKMRRWESAVLVLWAALGAGLYYRIVPTRLPVIWYAVLAIVSFLNTLRVLGAHDYESDGTPRDRYGQLADSIDTPGGPWTELWAPVGLRYHALHHYFPGIPYHNLGVAYRRLTVFLPGDSVYYASTNPSLRWSLKVLYQKAKRAATRSERRDALR